MLCVVIDCSFLLFYNFSLCGLLFIHILILLPIDIWIVSNTFYYKQYNNGHSCTYFLVICTQSFPRITIAASQDFHLLNFTRYQIVSTVFMPIHIPVIQVQQFTWLICSPTQNFVRHINFCQVSRYKMSLIILLTLHFPGEE